jgi:hypothetical protein
VLSRSATTRRLYRRPTSATPARLRRCPGQLRAHLRSVACDSHVLRTRFGQHVLCADRYVYARLGTNACPVGTARILVFSECFGISVALGLVWQGMSSSGTSGDPARPKGCYAAFTPYPNNSGVYFNEHQTGGTDFVCRPVCYYSNSTTAAPTQFPTTAGQPRTRLAVNWHARTMHCVVGNRCRRLCLVPNGQRSLNVELFGSAHAVPDSHSLPR